MHSRNEYIEKVKLQLDELNASLTQIEARAQEARADARATYHSEMDKLRVQSKHALAKLEEISNSTEEGWEKASAEMEKVRNAFVHAFSYFKSQV
jgi:chromosome segregation ATPase